MGDPDTADVSSAHFFFEGVEKSLEIDFVPGSCNSASEKGLRNLTRTQLDDLCTAAKCTIISTMSNDHVDSYVLSESSLFIYPYKIVLKTCGTTTLLMCLEPLLEATKALGMKVEWVAYTRKDFQRPGQQKFPHRDHNEEVSSLNMLLLMTRPRLTILLDLVCSLST
jgi:S-adenosylmethionine decarboxylase